MPVEYTTPVARIIWGSPTKRRDVKDTQTNTVRVDKEGRPRKQIAFGIAIPKGEAQPMLDAMGAAAAEIFPQGFPGNFAWKYKDGDTGIDNNGKPLSEREGHAGCYILACSTELVDSVGVFAFDHASQKWVATGDVKAGDYVKVTISFNAHKARTNTEKPGLYVNPNAVMLWQVGPEIKGASDFDPNARGFAAPPPQSPPPGGPLPGASAPAAPTPSAPAPAAPQAPNPHTAFLRGPQPDAN